MPIGPELPPHLLAKKKRLREEAEAVRATKESKCSPEAARSPTLDGGEKRRRIIGPAFPPAPLDERPDKPPSPHPNPSGPNAQNAVNASDSDSDDDFGPAIPTGDDDENSASAFDKPGANGAASSQWTEGHAKLKHDDWMMRPPDADSLSRIDPLRRPTKFASGKSAGIDKSGDSSIWHETPEQKRKRLENEVLGISEPTSQSKSSRKEDRTKREEDEEKRRQIEANRGKSLFELHEGKRKAEGKDAEDDPSRRAFDREKDMGGGTLNYAQRKEMMSRAANFGSRFSGGGYL